MQTTQQQPRALQLLTPNGEHYETLWMDEALHKRFQDLRGRLNMPSETALIRYLLNSGLQSVSRGQEAASSTDLALLVELEDAKARLQIAE